MAIEEIESHAGLLDTLDLAEKTSKAMQRDLE